MGFSPLKYLLNDSVKKAGIHDQVEASLVLEKATEILTRLFGDEGAKRMKPLYVKRRVLTVSCLSSVAAQDLKLREREILESINAEFSSPVVDRLRFFA